MNLERPLYADMLESLRRQSAEIVYDTIETLIIRENSTGYYSIATSNHSEAAQQILEIAKEGAVLIVHDKYLRDFACKKAGFEVGDSYWQTLYEKKELVSIIKCLDIRHPDLTDFNKITDVYRQLSENEILSLCSFEDFFGGYVGAELAGLVRILDDGSIGGLFIFEEYRDRGYALELMAYMINSQVQKGRFPFSQAYLDNVASIRLQKEVGMSFSPRQVHLLWKAPEE